uniref:C2H2-type domain-containing protein n=2 Tax=Photinus pyralis TaxID=7054 RepID=A0A1Y1KSI2_PHOPY
MGTLQLHCPLCCTETFSCHNSLKYHLLSISDNLICPACGKRFERIFDLAMHLGNQCVDPLVPEEPEHADETPERFSPICVKVEADDLTDTVTSSILARALTKDTSAIQQQNEEEVSENEDLYVCSTCDIQFNSIEDHVREFHDGHEVYLQSDKDEASVEPDNSCLLLVSADNGKEVEENMVIADHVSRAGLTCTPKLVKIEKFWNGKVGEDDTQAVEDDAESDGDGSVMEIYECVRCSLTFRTEEYFNKHKCKSSNFVIRKCTVCDASFTTVKSLNTHMKTHALGENPNPPFVCEVCNTEFPLFKSLRLHRRMHDPIKSKNIEPPVNYSLEGEEVEEAAREKFVCPICSKEYDKEYAEAHKKFHSEEKDYNCEICNRKFFSQENLDMHMHAHAEVKKFTCSYCKKGFLSSDKLEAHMSAQCQMRQYECQYCGRRFSRPHEKVKHERIHTGEKPHKCEICGKAFRVSYCLTLHMRTHSGIRPYKCDHCGKRFKAHSVYNHHLLTHSEDRKYKCPFCPKTFKTGVQLAGHKNSHTKPFTCTECNRPFASLYAVRSHMATHKRQNNLKFKCWLCGASYARSFALRDHIKEQHYENAKEAAQLGSLDFAITETIETGEAVLTDGDETMLIDMPGGEDVNSIEISGVAITLSDNN